MACTQCRSIFQQGAIWVEGGISAWFHTIWVCEREGAGFHQNFIQLEIFLHGFILCGGGGGGGGAIFHQGLKYSGDWERCFCFSRRPLKHGIFVHWLC